MRVTRAWTGACYFSPQRRLCASVTSCSKPTSRTSTGLKRCSDCQRAGAGLLSLRPSSEALSLAGGSQLGLGEDLAVAARLRHIIEPANEENLDRLAALLAGRDP